MKKIVLTLLAGLLCIPFVSKSQTCGTTNIALNKPTTVSGDQQYHLGSDAVDGNLSSGWFVPTESSFIYVDLQQSYTVCKIKINWSSDGRGKNYKAQISNDATNWTDMFTRTDNVATADSFTVSGTGRYVRISITSKVNSWSSLEMMELQIFNTIAGNVSPTVSLTAPANNASFIAGTNITLTANASDADGTISKVEFYQGTQKLGEVATSPYTFTWTNVQAGSYALTAKAFDNNNANATSTAVNITVTTPSSSGWSLTGNTSTNPGTNFLGTTDNKRLVFKTNNLEQMTILPDGYVGIGIATKPNAETKLGVNGAIYAKKIKVTQTGWADYVFNKEYKLPTLKEVENYIQKHKHLPGVPSTAEVEKNGTDIAEIQATLLRKIEELTLYIIEQNKKIETQQKEIDTLKKSMRSSRSGK